jgi:hypothetical protein
MPEPLILKVQADTQGVPEGLNRVTRSAEGLDVSSRKASVAIKGFVQDLAQARDGADVASAALGAFSKILGTSLAATGVVIAGKAIVDSFQKVATIVEETRDRIAKASAEIKKSGLDVGFSQASAEAKRLSDEAESARASIEKLDKSFLLGLVATITGAREELGKLAQESEKLSQQRLFEGARAERIRTEERAGLEGGALQVRDVQERLAKELQAVNVLTPEGAAAANELRKRAELDIQAIRKKAEDEFYQKQSQQELKLIDADIAGAEAAAKIARQSDRDAAKQAEESLNRLYEERAKKEEEIRKKQEKATKESVLLQEKVLDAQDRVNEARKRVIEADAEVADLALKASGTGRGAGQRATSLEIGAQRAAERAFQNEQRRLTRQAYEDFKLASEVVGQPADRYSFNREQQRRLEEQQKQAAREPFNQQEEAQKNLQSSEAYLKAINKLLEDNLNELKTYAHVV